MAQTTRTRGRPHIDRHGRIVIPAELRRELGFEPGEPLTLSVENGGLLLRTVKQHLEHVQALVRERTGGKTGLLDEFIADRRREAERE